MFLPKFTITNKVLNGLIKAELDLAYLKSVEVPVEWLQKLEIENKTKRLISTLSFDNFEVSSEFVVKLILEDPSRDEKPSELAERLNFSAKERDVQMALNWINSNKLVDQIAYISSKFSQERITEKELRHLNSMIGERMVPLEQQGSYRKDNVLSDSLMTYCKFNEIEYQMEDLFMWFNTAGKDKIHPVIKSVIVFFELLRIRPFENYNLQTSLFFSQAFLGSVGYKFLYGTYEEELYKQSQKLFEICLDIEKRGSDLTELVEFFVSVINTVLEKAKLRVTGIEGSGLKYKTTVGRAVALSERQIAIMEEITVLNQMTIKEIRQVVPLVSDDTILRDLKDLEAKKMIRKRGKTKGAVYILGKTKGIR